MSPTPASAGQGRNVAEMRMTSSANDVWGVIFASTSVFPRVLPKLYKEINTTKPDGYSSNSMREIIYGHASEVDHTKRTVSYTVTSGGFLEYHATFETTIQVTPTDGDSPRDPGCKVLWTCEYTEATGGLSPVIVKEFMIKTFEGLDSHLKKLQASGV
ncbi:MLP-like protein 423 [Linum grandiflorum]